MGTVARRTLTDLYILGWLSFFREFQSRYRMAFFGPTWVILKPILAAMPLILVGKQFDFGKNLDSSVPYEIYAFSGFVLFQVFWDSIHYTMWMSRRMRRTIKMMTSNLDSPILAGIYYAGFNFSVYFVILVGAMIYFQAPVHATAWFALLGLPLVVLTGVSIGLILTPLSLIYLDIRQALPFLSQAIIWLTPIFYVKPTEGILATLCQFNPLTYLIGTIRDWIFMGHSEHTAIFLGVSLFVVLMALYAYRYYLKTIRIATENMI